MRVARLLVILTALALMLASAAPAGADHSWGNYHWARTANPFTLNLGDNVSGDWDAHLSTSSGDWTQSSVLDTRVVAGGTRPRPCKATDGRVEVCNARYGNNGWLGLAQIWISGSHIVKGVAKVNDTYFDSAPYNDPNAKLHVMCQEVGHTLGLDHQTAASCMDDRNGLFDPAYVSPNQHDYEQLETIYAHTDSTSTVGQIARGKGVRVSHDGRYRVVTFIFWA
jgi:hypothetical protein